MKQLPDNINIVYEDSDGDAFTFGAYTDEGELAGLLRVQIEPLQYTLEGIYVKPEYRRQGIATALLDTFLGSAGDGTTMPCNMTFAEDEDGSLLEFMDQRNDFIVIEAGVNFNTTNRDFMANGSVQAMIKRGISGDVKALEALSDKEVVRIYSDLKRLSLADIRSAGDILYVYDPKLSSVYIKHNKVLSCVLVKHDEAGRASVDAVYSRSKGLATLETMARTFVAIDAENPDMEISVFTINEVAGRLTDKLLEKATRIKKSRTYIASWLMTPNMDMNEMMAAMASTAGTQQ